MDLERAHRNVVELMRSALQAATSPEELLDCARGAAATGDVELTQDVMERLAASIEELMESASSWSVQATFSKLEVWQRTGHQARILAEAWGELAPLLGDQR